jgi:hypothetical protein
VKIRPNLRYPPFEIPQYLVVEDDNDCVFWAVAAALKLEPAVNIIRRDEFEQIDPLFRIKFDQTESKGTFRRCEGKEGRRR